MKNALVLNSVVVYTEQAVAFYGCLVENDSSGVRPVVEWGSGGSVPLVKVMRTFRGLSPLYQTFVRLEKFLTMHLRKEERGKVSSYQEILPQFSPRSIFYIIYNPKPAFSFI